MSTDLKIYHLLPIAEPDDPRWENSPAQGKVVVRAHSPGDARLAAQEAEGDFLGRDAMPAEGTSTAMASAFRSEKLYTVQLDTTGAYPSDGPRGVVDGHLHDVLRH